MYVIKPSANSFKATDKPLRVPLFAFKNSEPFPLFRAYI